MALIYRNRTTGVQFPAYFHVLLVLDATGSMISWVRELREMLGIPDNFHGCGIPQRSYVARIDEFIAKSVGFPATITNPRKPSLDDLKSLYLASYEGDYGRL